MNQAVKISRIVTCIAAALYTAFVCYLCGQMAYRYCVKILMDDAGAYYSDVSGITREAVPHIVVGAVLLLLGAVSIVLLFRRGRLSACLSGGASVACAILGMCIDTKLAEVMFARYTLGMDRLNWDVEALLSFKSMAARFCILATVVYVVLCLIAHRKQK
ncbi:MAG: hypothetical protein IJY27_06650 [Clostridia bacterium]|nr:hypothetical protein [Clostridia bacterium]